MEKEQLVKIVSAAQSGDADALNTLFNTFYQDIYYFALKNVKDESLAEDITQEAFIEIINTLGNLKEPAAFVTWSKQITYHQCTRYFKKKKDVIVDEDAEGHSVFDTVAEENAEFIPGELLDQDEFRQTILAILDELSEEQRSATMMYYFDEMSVKEIAEVQGVSEGTVKSRLNYARKSIKASVEEYEKKNGIKLHGIGGLGILPLIKWLMQGAIGGAMPLTTATAVAEGIATATGAAITVTAATATAATATTAAATAAGIGLGTKIVAGIAAATIVIGGGTASVVLSKHDSTPAGTSSVVQSVTDSTSSATSSDVSSEISSQYSGTGVEKLSNGEFEIVEIVPQGGKYYKADGTVLTPGQSLPEKFTQGDYFVYKDYVYGYECTAYSDNGGFKTNNYQNMAHYIGNSEGAKYAAGSWFVRAIDPDRASYGTIASYIGKKPVAHLYCTYSYCTQMTTLSGIRIPSTARTMIGTFLNTSFLGNAPLTDASMLKIPSSVKVLNYAFADCDKLEKAPVIPAGVVSMANTFAGCSALNGDITINANPTSYGNCFILTSKSINLVGSSKKLGALAATSDENNITVGGAEPAEVTQKFLKEDLESLRKGFGHATPLNFGSTADTDEALIFTLAYMLDGMEHTGANQYKAPTASLRSTMYRIFGVSLSATNGTVSTEYTTATLTTSGNYTTVQWAFPPTGAATLERCTMVDATHCTAVYKTTQTYYTADGSGNLTSLVIEPYFTCTVSLERSEGSTDWKIVKAESVLAE